MIDVLFWLFLVVTIYTDLKYQKIYNWSTFPVAIFGILYNTLTHLPSFNGFINSATGLVVGLALLGWVYRLGGCGGGDVKFLGAIGALLGYEFVVMGALWGFIVAGVFASVLLLLTGQFKTTWGNTFNFIKLFFLTGSKVMSHNPLAINMPYGVFLSIGMGLFKLWQSL